MAILVFDRLMWQTAHMQSRKAEECQSLGEVRAEIDRIDRTIVRAIGERKPYVLAAAAFKPNAKDVAAPERFAAMLQARRMWAEEEGLNPDIIERLFRDLVNHFIEEERRHWSTKRDSGSTG